MAKLAWTPWHKVVQVRPDLKSGELSLNSFAADLYDVMLGTKKTVYNDPKDFFALTYPTFTLRELARDVITRLAGKSDKAVRQLELTYGGGKTHTLITLYHLANDPDHLPDLPTVNEFIEHAGVRPSRARVAVLPFDKLDVEKGMKVRDPSGNIRWLMHPWSVIAYQIAGDEGLRLLHVDNKDEERETPPAENLLVELLSIPAKDGLATLILIDEVLMYARGKVGLNAIWRERIQDFFQYLTQAAVKVDRCAIVASLLASEPGKADYVGKEIQKDLSSIFRRQREETAQPVQKDDVAEVLRRRFFTPESVLNKDAFGPHVMAALKGITELDDQTQKEGKAAEDRFRDNYPFHPDLTEVFYTKWTQLEGFQRTRGILRTFALAIRDAEVWDQAPLIGPNVFLGPDWRNNLGEAARELANVAATEEYEGKRQEWLPILEGELARARSIQKEYPGLRHREVEQAVIATFLHSQPISHKAQTRDLMLLLGPTRPDRIELEKALRRWADSSYFLDEEELAHVDGTLPKAWRLGSKPNLTQMHGDAMTRVSGDFVEGKLITEIEKAKNHLTTGAQAAGAKFHLLPASPKDVDDDGEFRYVVLGPKAASESGKPSPEARRYLDEKSGPDAPRVFRNAIVLAVPSRDGLDVIRQRIQDYLAWEDVRTQLANQKLDPSRQGRLAENLKTASDRIPEAVIQAYCIVVTVSDKNESQAFRLTMGSGPLFTQIKNDERSRIQETAISAEALLPEGPYDLWREGDEARRVKDLVGAFAQFPHLPKMLNRKAIMDTLITACVHGLLVVRTYRPDKSVKTYWYEAPEEAALKEATTEAVLPNRATLSDIPVATLIPGALPGLWNGNELAVSELYVYFGGSHIVQVEREGYHEPFSVPGATQDVIDRAICDAVREGKLWMTNGAVSILGEEIPAGLLTVDAVLQAPPAPISPTHLLATAVPDAWIGEKTTVLALSVALSKKIGKPLPWTVIKQGVEAALKYRMLERTPESGVWPCDYSGAHTVIVRVPSAESVPGLSSVVAPASAGVLVAQAKLKADQLQDLVDQLAEIKKVAAGVPMEFSLRITVGGGAKPSDTVIAKLNEVLGAIDNELKLG